MKIVSVCAAAMAAAWVGVAYADGPSPDFTDLVSRLEDKKAAEAAVDAEAVKTKAVEKADEADRVAAKKIAAPTIARVSKNDAAATTHSKVASDVPPGVDMTVTGSIPPAKAAALADVTEKVVTPVTYAPIIARYASAYGVPVELATAVIKIESNFRANATGSAGEIGLMQIKPATARMVGYTGSAKGLYDPDTNLRWGMKYLAMAQKLGGGNVCGTILRYNAGHAATRMNPVSAAYCAKVKTKMAGA